MFILYDNSLFEISLSDGPRNLSTTAMVTNCWPVVQTLCLSNTDTLVPFGDCGKYANTRYFYLPEQQNNGS
eukprot:UN07712